MAAAALVALLLMSMVIGCVILCVSVVFAVLKRRQQASKGKKNTVKPTHQWSMPYGDNKGGEPFEFMCGPGEFMPIVMFTALPGKFPLRGNTDDLPNSISGIGAMCHNIRTGEQRVSSRRDKKGQETPFFGDVEYEPSKFKKIMNVATKVGEFIVRAVADVVTFGASEVAFIPLDVLRFKGVIPNDIFANKPGGAKLYMAASPNGINRVRIASDEYGPSGLEFIAPDGATSKFGGFDVYKYANQGNSNIVAEFKCEKGKTLTGIKGRAGERVDRLQFRCSTV